MEAERVDGNSTFQYIRASGVDGTNTTPPQLSSTSEVRFLTMIDHGFILDVLGTFFLMVLVGRSALDFYVPPTPSIRVDGNSKY